MVFNDLLQNPLIVPLKILRGHQLVKKKKQKDNEIEEDASLGIFGSLLKLPYEKEKSTDV